MASVVRAALCEVMTVLERDQVDEERSRKVRLFIQAITMNESCVKHFDMFSSRLTNALEKCFFSYVSQDSSCRSRCARREKVWAAFHQLRMREVDRMWRDHLEQYGIPVLTALVYQHVTQNLYFDLIRRHIADTVEEHPSEIPPLDMQLGMYRISF